MELERNQGGIANIRLGSMERTTDSAYFNG